jgi:hypothetical protein
MSSRICYNLAIISDKIKNKNKQMKHLRLGKVLAAVFIAAFFLSTQNSRAIFDSINTSSYITLGQTGTTFNQPWATATCNGKMFVADYDNNRVLIYNSIPTAAGTTADYVIGQTSLAGTQANQGLSAPLANTLKQPGGVFCDGNKLYISDTNNNRVLIYNSIPVSNNASANVVVGQADFTHNSDNQGGFTGDNTLYAPTGILVHSSKLYISDLVNNRVLIYNTIPTSSDAHANVVIGQANMGTANTGVGTQGLHGPRGLFISGTKLIIADNFNSRVLIFNTIPTSDHASASVVVGQANFTDNLSNRGGSAASNTLSSPTDILVRGSKLIISDTSNNRLLVFDTIPTSNNASANTVITSLGLSTAMGICTSADKLLLANYGASRVLVINLNITYPTVNNVTNGVTYDQDVTPTFSAPIAYLDGGSFISGETIASEGDHTLTVTDSEGDSTTINFTIQKAAVSENIIVASTNVPTLTYSRKKSAKRYMNLTFFDLNLAKKFKKSWVNVHFGTKKAKISRVRNSGANLAVKVRLTYGRMPIGSYAVTMNYRNKVGKTWERGTKYQDSLLTIQ